MTNPVDFGEFRIGPERWQVLVGLGGGMDAGLSVSAGFMWTSADIGKGGERNRRGGLPPVLSTEFRQKLEIPRKCKKKYRKIVCNLLL